MTHLDQMIADSLAQSSDTVVHQLASEVVRLRADLKRGGVVVPDLTDSAMDLACGCALPPAFGSDAIKYGLRMARRGGYRNGWEDLASRLRTIPADRVLGEGEERIDSASLDAYKSAFVLAKWASERGISFGWRISFAAIARHFDALRAQPTQEPTT